jgi:hypothetical protein
VLQVECHAGAQVQVDPELFTRPVDALQEPPRALHPALCLGRPAESQRIEDELDREPRRQPVVARLAGEAVAALVRVEGRFLVEQRARSDPEAVERLGRVAGFERALEMTARLLP